MESTSHISPFRVVVFYLVATSWNFDSSLCENPLNQSNVKKMTNFSKLIIELICAFNSLIIMPAVTTGYAKGIKKKRMLLVLPMMTRSLKHGQFSVSIIQPLINSVKN